MKKLYEVDNYTDLKDMINKNVIKFGERPAFLQKDLKGGDYNHISYHQFYDDVNSLGTALLDMNLKDEKIAVIGENCYDCVVAYYATVCGVGTVVPLDKELKPYEINNLITQSGCKAVFYTENFEGVFDAKCLEHEVRIWQYADNEKKAKSVDGVTSITSLIADGRESLEKGKRDFVDAEIDPDKMHMLLYTSGTTGKAKGVMLTHKNIMSNVRDILSIVKVYPEDRSLSILPIHHTFESTIGITTVLSAGASIAFCEGLKYIAKNFKEAKASIMIAVPLLIESMYKKIMKGVAEKKKMGSLKFGIKLNRTLKALGIDQKKRIFNSIYKNFGGKLRLVVTGAASIDPSVCRGFEDLGIKVVQGYGLTECSPLVTGAPDFENTYKKAGSVGLTVVSGEVDIIEKDEENIGEIIFKGPNVMLGYYDMKKETEKVLKDGWFYTGDLGFIDKEGWVYIAGRKKNIIVTKTGKNIYPEELEVYFGKNRFIDEIMVYGATDEDDPDSDTIVSAQIRPDFEEIKKEYGADKNEEEVYDLIKSAIANMNQEIPTYKRIRSITIRREEFDKTTTKKIKRHTNI